MNEQKNTYEEFGNVRDKLYYGEIILCEQCGMKWSELKEEEAKLAEIYEEMLKRYPEISEFWEEVRTQQSKDDSLYAVNEFGKGYRLGARLTLLGLKDS